MHTERFKVLIFPGYFRITNRQIEIFLWPIKYSFPIEEVEKVKVCKIPWFVGIGIRAHFWSKTLYFVYRRGKGICIEKKGGFWKKIVVSADRRFLSALRKFKKSLQ